VEVFREDLAADAGVPVDQVLPLVVVDPGQRFAGQGESEKRAIDALFSSIVQVLCGELGCAVLATSDTTKQAAREVNIDAFLSKEPAALAADIFAGSQAIMHNADVHAVCAERQQVAAGEDGPPPAVGRGSALHATQWVRLLKNRAGLPAVGFPFGWDMHLGRFTPGEPEPLRPPQERDGQGQPTRHGGGTSAAPQARVPHLDPDAHYRLHKRGARFRGGAGQAEGDEDVGTVFTRLAREAVQREGRPDPHPGRRWWDDVVLSGREAARVMEVLQLQHERVG
jgi:hypothetical protein